MKRDERHHTADDIFVGIDLATRQHQVCMSKLLHYAFAVVTHRTAFDADRVWREVSTAA